MIDFADKGQIIEWDEENMKFYHMHQKKGYIDEHELRKMFKQMISGLENCNIRKIFANSCLVHNSGIIHRDIKPQNILEAQNGRIIIADLGVAATIEKGDIQTKTEGTYHFMCPESLNKEGTNEGYSGKAADVWALGITFYAFIYYKLPFNSENLMELFELIEKQP